MLHLECFPDISSQQGQKFYWNLATEKKQVHNACENKLSKHSIGWRTWESESEVWAVMKANERPFAKPSFMSESAMPAQACSQLPTLVAIVTHWQREVPIVAGINSEVWQWCTKPSSPLHRKSSTKKPLAPSVRASKAQCVCVCLCVGGKGGVWEEVNQDWDGEGRRSRDREIACEWMCGRGAWPLCLFPCSPFQSH